ncbi:hypothetical protein GQ42DRAFT_171767 [Ramicandelaber brevisporus]|nr:hypothetical protein GQ42DRAFT_171767 [Ramicandelaber brevisporus]
MTLTHSRLSASRLIMAILILASHSCLLQHRSTASALAIPPVYPPAIPLSPGLSPLSNKNGGGAKMAVTGNPNNNKANNDATQPKGQSSPVQGTIQVIGQPAQSSGPAAAVLASAQTQAQAPAPSDPSPPPSQPSPTIQVVDTPPQSPSPPSPLPPPPAQSPVASPAPPLSTLPPISVFTDPPISIPVASTFAAPTMTVTQQITAPPITQIQFQTQTQIQTQFQTQTVTSTMTPIAVQSPSSSPSLIILQTVQVPGQTFTVTEKFSTSTSFIANLVFPTPPIGAAAPFMGPAPGYKAGPPQIQPFGPSPPIQPAIIPSPPPLPPMPQPQQLLPQPPPPPAPQMPPTQVPEQPQFIQHTITQTEHATIVAPTLIPGNTVVVDPARPGIVEVFEDMFLGPPSSTIPPPDAVLATKLATTGLKDSPPEVNGRGSPPMMAASPWGLAMKISRMVPLFSNSMGGAGANNGKVMMEMDGPSNGSGDMGDYDDYSADTMPRVLRHQLHQKSPIGKSNSVPYPIRTRPTVTAVLPLRSMLSQLGGGNGIL